MLFLLNLKDSKNKGMCRNVVEIENTSLVYTSYKTL
jgi:hypothetical protein